MATETAGTTSQPNRFARQLFDGLPARYDRLAEVLSFGQNRRWRKAMVDAVVSGSPASVLDVATGPAGVALEIAARTSARVTGVDLTPQMLKAGAANVARSPQAGRVHLAVARAEELPFADATFDALTFTYLLRYVADPAATVKELARVVKPGGVIANLEFHTPTGRAWHPLWVLYTRVGLPVAGFVLGGREWFRVGRFLGPSISRALSPLPHLMAPGCLGRCRHRRREGEPHEPGRWARDVGPQAARLARRPGPARPQDRAEALATSG